MTRVAIGCWLTLMLLGGLTRACQTQTQPKQTAQVNLS